MKAADGVVKAVCISREKGVPKEDMGQGLLIENHGLENDAHAGNWHRQISLLSSDKIDEFKAEHPEVNIKPGAFGENLVVGGVDFARLPVGTVMEAGEGVLELSQIGKECHSGCIIAQTAGKCIMPTEGVFARVIKGGRIKTGDAVRIKASGEDAAPAGENEYHKTEYK